MSFPYPVYPLSYNADRLRYLFEIYVDVFLEKFDEDEQPQYYLPYLFNHNMSGFDFLPGMYRKFRHFRSELKEFLESNSMLNGLQWFEHQMCVLELMNYYRCLDCTTPENRDYVMYRIHQHSLNRDWALQNAHLAHKVM